MRRHNLWIKRLMSFSVLSSHCYCHAMRRPHIAMLSPRDPASIARLRFRSTFSCSAFCVSSESLATLTGKKWYSSPLDRNLPRRRRGLIRSKMVNETDTESVRMPDKCSDNLPLTQYTINDSICSPTDPILLRKIVQKHIDTLPKYLQSKPIAKYNTDAFNEALDFITGFGLQQQSGIERVKVILDSGCGTARSTSIIGEMHPDCVIIGIDRSLVRLNRNMDYRNRDGSTDGNKYTENFDTPSKNVLLLRADLVDFWHLCLTSPEWQQKVCVHKHYLLYPNPYPKKARLKSRFYVHPAFPLLMLTMMMGGNDADRRMIVRSNWEGYLKEFSIAVKVWEESGLSFNSAKDAAILDSMGDTDDTCGGEHTDTQYWIVNGPKRLCNKNAPMTNFEAKYFACGEPAYEIQVTFQTSSKEDS